MIKATSQSVCSGITGCQVELLGSGAELIKEYKGVTVAMYRSLRGHMPEELATMLLQERLLMEKQVLRQFVQARLQLRMRRLKQKLATCLFRQH